MAGFAAHATISESPLAIPTHGDRSAALGEALAQARLAIRYDAAAAERWINHMEWLLVDSTEQVCGQAPPAANGVGLTPWQVRRVQRYVESNIGGRLRAAELAAIARLSENHFGRAFKNTFGSPPHAYITERRIHHAKMLILGTDLPLSQVALEAGLSDQAHLSRLFRRFFGGTPSAWRRQNRGSAKTSPLEAA